MCRVQTEILSSHYSTTKMHSLFGLNQQGEAQPHTHVLHWSRNKREGKNGSSQPSLSSQQQWGFFNTGTTGNTLASHLPFKLTT